MCLYRIGAYLTVGLAVLLLSVATPLRMRSQCQPPGGGGGGSGCEDCTGTCQRCDEEAGACYDDNCSSGCDEANNGAGCGDCEYCQGSSCETDPECYGPLLIDLDGDGYDMTSAANGVTFDINGSGKPIKISWTAAGANDAWLALDSNANGRVDDGTELFGNHTRLPRGLRPANGFEALATYDRVENGGNSNGVIDSGDAVYQRLLLWVDRNHNGLSEGDELSTLRQSTISVISLRYQRFRRVDQYGNIFRYRAKLRDSKTARVGKFLYDVLLRPEGVPINSRAYYQRKPNGPSLRRPPVRSRVSGLAPSRRVVPALPMRARTIIQAQRDLR